MSLEDMCTVHVLECFLDINLWPKFRMFLKASNTHLWLESFAATDFVQGQQRVLLHRRIVC